MGEKIRLSFGYKILSFCIEQTHAELKPTQSPEQLSDPQSQTFAANKTHWSQKFLRPQHMPGYRSLSSQAVMHLSCPESQAGCCTQAEVHLHL